MLYDVAVLESIMKPSDIRSDIGRPVSYYPALAKACGGAKAAILLCQLIYWTNRQDDPDGWIYKVSSDLETEVGLNWEEQKTARKHLVKRGLIAERYDRNNHRMWFKIDVRNIAALNLESSGKVQVLPPELSEKVGEVAGKVQEAISESPIRSIHRFSETTPKNTEEHRFRPADVPLASSRMDDYREGLNFALETSRAIRKRA